MHNNNSQESFYSKDQDDPYASTQIDQQFDSAQEMYEPISWTASEFIEHEKSIYWYLVLMLITLVLAAVSYLTLNKDIYGSVIVLIFGVVFGLAGARKPRVLNYSVGDDGLSVDNKHFNFETFKHFSVISDGPVASIMLMPAKRFSPPITLYVPQDKLDEVTNTIGSFLPMEQHTVGYVDKFLGKIKY